MSKNFTITALAQPQDLSASLQEGGSLTANTTYYYQIFAMRNGTVWSPRTPTVSIATTSTRRKVRLDWTAIPGFAPSGDYSCYVVLRNTTDSFKDQQNVCIMKPADTNLHNPVQTNWFVDDGSFTLRQICHFKGGLPEIRCWGGTSNDPITMWDIYQWALANAPGRVQPALNPDFLDFDDWKRHDMFWIVHASLRIGWDGSANQTAFFSHAKAGGIIIYGCFGTSSLSTVQFGEKVNVEDANQNWQPVLMVYGPQNFQVGRLEGLLRLYGLRLARGGLSWGSYSYMSWNQSFSLPGLTGQAGSEVLDCDFAEKGNGYDLVGAGVAKGCRFPGLRPQAGWMMERPKITLSEGLGLRSYDGATIREALTTWGTRDIIWRTTLTHTLIDCTFRAKQQADNRPWLFLGYGNGLGGSLTFKHSARGQVRDQEGNVLTGAQVTIRDALGATVFSGATDANGEFFAGDLTVRVLTPTNQVNGVWSVTNAHEDTMVADGWLARAWHTPHVLTIEKAGYQTYQDVVEINRKLDLEVALSPFGPKNKLEVALRPSHPLEVQLFARRLVVELGGKEN